MKEGGGKVLIFVALFIFPIIAAVVGVNTHLDNSKKTSFCLSCHVMKTYGESLYIDDANYLPASHFQNNRVPRESACYTCHIQYTMYGGITAKLRGLRHVFVNYLGNIPDPIETYTPYENRECLHCHDGARSFEENVIHNSMLSEFKSDDVSCLYCHNLIHNVSELPELELWKAEVSK